MCLLLCSFRHRIVNSYLKFTRHCRTMKKILSFLKKFKIWIIRCQKFESIMWSSSNHWLVTCPFFQPWHLNLNLNFSWKSFFVQELFGPFKLIGVHTLSFLDNPADIKIIVHTTKIASSELLPGFYYVFVTY